MSNNIEYADRLKKIPPYLFVEIDKAKQRAIQEGRDVIDLGVGDPDLGAPGFVINALNKSVSQSKNHRYALDAGLPRLRKAISVWHHKRFNVRLNPDNEIYPLIGSKEGIAHLPLAILNPGESVLVPDPCYPPYRSSTIIAGARPILLPLRQENNFLPSLKDIRENISSSKKARLIFLNYPNNPTSACADRKFFEEIVKTAKRNNIIIASDLAYSEIYYDNKRPPSILEIEGAKNIAVEFNSLSKSYNMSGWRIGWVCGNSKVISALAKIKTNIDSGIFQPVQLAAIAALDSDGSFTEKMRQVYQKRRDLFVEGLNSLGWPAKRPDATFYLWLKIPSPHKDSVKFTKNMLEKIDLIVTPGVGFGPSGEGFIRIALTVSEDKIKKALERIKGWL